MKKLYAIISSSRLIFCSLFYHLLALSEVGEGVDGEGEGKSIFYLVFIMNIYKYYTTAIFSLGNLTEFSLCCQQLLAPSFYITIASNFWWSEKYTVNFKIRPHIRADSKHVKLHVLYSTNILFLHPHWFSPHPSPVR